MNEECLTVEMNVKDFNTFDNKFEIHQTYESTYFLEEKIKNV